MAAPTTLVALANHYKTTATSNLNATRTSLQASRTELGAAKQQSDAATAIVAAREREIAALRIQLAQAPTTADGEAILQQLELKLVESRAQQAALDDAQVRIAEAGSSVDALAKQADGFNGRIAQATTDVQTQTADAAKRQGYQDAIATGVAKDVKADATALLASQLYADAKARIESDVPTELRDRARDRHKKAGDRLVLISTAGTDSSTAVATLQNTNGGLTGKSYKALQEFQRTVAAVAAYATRAKEKLERARGLLQMVADSARNPLTAAQRTRINAATLTTPGIAAATKEADRDAKRAEVAAKQSAYDKAVSDARAADIDTDPLTAGPVVAAKGQLDTVKGLLTTAETAYTNAMRADLNKWEAAVPDTAWRLFADFEEATRLLTELSATDPGPLVTAMNNAEAAYTAALFAEDKDRRTLASLRVSAELADTRLKAEQGLTGHRLFSALRGDA